MTEELDLTQLRAVAEAATPGPWFREYSDVVVREPDPRDVKFYDDPRNMRIVRGAEHLKLRDKQGIANAVHISTFDPPTVLALLSRLEQAEQRVALLESGIVAGIVNTSVFTAKAIGAEVSSVSESILNMGYPALREQLEQAERLLERVRSEAQELADMNEPAGENFLSILDGEQDG